MGGEMKEMTLIEKLVAIELGHEWEVLQNEVKDDFMWAKNSDQSLKCAIECIGRRGYEIRLTAKEWDWPVCNRPHIECWLRGEWPNPHTGESFWDAWYLDVFSKDFQTSAQRWQAAIPDPKNPEKRPPDNWSPHEKRVIS